MTALFSKGAVKKKLQGKSLSDSLTEKLAKDSGEKSFDQIKAKNVIATMLAGKSKRFADERFKKLGLDAKERSKFLNEISGEKVINKLGLTPEQKRRNIAESRISELNGLKKADIKSQYGEMSRLGINKKPVGFAGQRTVTPPADMQPPNNPTGIRPMGF